MRLQDAVFGRGSGKAGARGLLLCRDRVLAMQWLGHVDEVIVVDDHITGILSEYEAGKQLDVPASGVRITGPAQPRVGIFKWWMLEQGRAVRLLKTPPRS